MSSQPPMGGAPVAGNFDGSTPDDEQLVAYLDGELDQDGVAEIETKLASDPRLRTRLNDLRSAWDLLEELPAVKPNPKFARSTIEMVAMSAASQAETKSDPLRNWRMWSVVLLVLPLMFGAGYAIMRSTQRSAERQALAELRVLADWDALKAVERYDWLKKIRTVSDLDRVAKRSSASGLGIGLVPATLDERREWIQKLSNTGRDRLSANLEEFKRSSPALRQRIIALADQIYAGPDPQGDLQAARDYAQFLSELSISDRVAHFDKKDDAERLSDLTRRVNRKMVDVYTQELAPDSADRQAVRNWIQEMQDQYGTSLPRGNVLFDLRRRTAFGDSVIDDVDLDYLLESLTPEAQEIIERLKTPEAKHAALILFVLDTQEGSPGSGSRRNIDRAELTKRFDTLPEERRGVIEFLPPETAQQDLGMRSDARSPDIGRFSPTPPSASKQFRQDALPPGENKAAPSSPRAP